MRATLDARDFTLTRTLNQLATQISTQVPGTTAKGIFRQFWDTLATAADGVTKGPHCDDNGGMLNGFPLSCYENGSQQAMGSDLVIEQRMKEYAPLALINRLDLAHEGWRNCGEYRIIYAKYQGLPAQGNLDIDMIFEAVLPNPKPGCRDGCMAVAKFWKSLSQIADPAVRAQKLEQFFYQGLPGYRPVVHVDHYGAQGLFSVLGSSRGGQIRSSYYFLREYRTSIDCGSAPCQYRSLPMPVQQSPFDGLWNEDLAHSNNSNPLRALAEGFQAAVLAQKTSLAAGNLMDIDYAVKLDYDAVCSSEFCRDGPGKPPSQEKPYLDIFNSASGPFTAFRSGLAAGNLTAAQMVRRAQALTCTGCHFPDKTVNADGGIGPVTTPTGQTTSLWPAAIEWHKTHVEARVTSPPELASPVFGSGRGQRLSPALLDVFLPARKQFLMAQLNAPSCGCQDKFVFLADTIGRRALEVADQERHAYAPRFTALADEIRANSTLPPDTPVRVRLESATAQLFASFQADFDAKLRQIGVVIPFSDPGDLKPQPLRLTLTTGSIQAQEASRVAQVIAILKALPPRRTVTGSSRVH